MSTPAERTGAIKDHLNPVSARAELEAVIARALETHELPQAVIEATSSKGTFYKYFGGITSKEDDARLVKEDDIFMLASQTKLVTSIAALQCMEQGLISLDSNVEEIIPELAKQPILEGFDDDDKPLIKKRTKPLLFKHLLTHTSGMSYDGGEPIIMQWQDLHDREMNSGATVVERFDFPLLFEPGERWNYGSSMDWAGLVIERISNGTLEEFFHKHIFSPLGIKEATFWPAKRPEMEGRVLKISFRADDGGLETYSGLNPNNGSTDCFGGQGLYATMAEYAKILHALLKNDGTLMKPETRQLMFTPHLTQPQADSLMEVMQGPAGAYFVGEFNNDVPLNWGIGGMMFMKDDEGRRKAGTLQWSGMPNTFWILDPAADLALTFGTQVFMPGDRIVAKNITAIEKAVYKMAGVKFQIASLQTA